MEPSPRGASTALVYDAVIIGAGPAGSAAAAALAAHGHHVLLVERDDFPRHKVCGEFLSPEAQDTLAALGLVSALNGQGPLPLHQVSIHAPGGEHLQRPLPGIAWGLSRYAMDRTLAHAAVARGATLWTGATAVRTVRCASHFMVTVRRDRRTYDAAARVVLLAAGRQIRTALCPQPARHLPHRPRQARFVGVKRHYTGLALPPQVNLFLFDGGYAGINPIEDGRANLCLLVEEATFRAAGGTVEAMISHAAAVNPALAERLGGGCPVADTSCAVGAVNTEAPAHPWQGLPRLGDAAVMLPPFAGDGMAMALRSAELCAAGADAYLRGACTWDEWQAHFTHAWHTEFDPRVRLARRLQRALMRPYLAGRLLTVGSWLPWAADYVVRATRGAAASSASGSTTG